MRSGSRKVKQIGSDWEKQMVTHSRKVMDYYWGTPTAKRMDLLKDLPRETGLDCRSDSLTEMHFRSRLDLPMD